MTPTCLESIWFCSWSCWSCEAISRGVRKDVGGEGWVADLGASKKVSSSRSSVRSVAALLPVSSAIESRSSTIRVGAGGETIGFMIVEVLDCVITGIIVDLYFDRKFSSVEVMSVTSLCSTAVEATKLRALNIFGIWLMLCPASTSALPADRGSLI